MNVEKQKNGKCKNTFALIGDCKYEYNAAKKLKSTNNDNIFIVHIINLIDYLPLNNLRMIPYRLWHSCSAL